MEKDGNGNVTAQYDYGTGVDEVLSQRRSNVTRYYHLDGLGSVVMLTNAAEAIEESYYYDAFGQVKIYNSAKQLRTTSSFDNRFMYTGREYEPELAMYYYRNRFYHPTLGKFLQRDPIGHFDSMNLFAYTNNNPINFVDSMGLWLGVDDILTGPADEILVTGALYAAYQASKTNVRTSSISTSRTNNKDNQGAYYRHYTSYEGLSGIKQIKEIWASLGGTYGAGVYLTRPGVPSFLVKPKSGETYVDVWVPNTVRMNSSLWKSHKLTLENVYQGGNYPIYNDPEHPPIFDSSK